MNFKSIIRLLLIVLSIQCKAQPGIEQNDCITALGLIRVDMCRHSFSFPATVNMSKGLIEVVVCTPNGKTHESLFITDADPVTFEAALNLIGCVSTEPYAFFISKPSAVLKIKHKKKKPDRVEVWVEYQDSLGPQTERIESFIWDELNKRSLEGVYWHFKGILRDEAGNPLPFIGNNLIVTFLDPDSILEMDSPRLFNDNYFFANNKKNNFFVNKEVIIHVKRIQ